MKNIGKPCAGEPQARFDEGGLMNDQAGRHVVVACDEALTKVLTMLGKSAPYSTRNSPPNKLTLLIFSSKFKIQVLIYGEIYPIVKNTFLDTQWPPSLFFLKLCRFSETIIHNDWVN